MTQVGIIMHYLLLQPASSLLALDQATDATHTHTHIFYNYAKKLFP